jgi:hypothetical protein
LLKNIEESTELIQKNEDETTSTRHRKQEEYTKTSMKRSERRNLRIKKDLRTYVSGFVLKSEDSYLTTSYFQVEDRISGGRFFKFTGNENPTNVLAHELFNCLTHHSYVISGGEYMLVDSQGSIKKLTDPEFHSNVADGNGNYGKSNNTGEGDLGVDGMNTFLANHVCGEICKCLTLDEQ